MFCVETENGVFFVFPFLGLKTVNLESLLCLFKWVFLDYLGFSFGFVAFLDSLLVSAVCTWNMNNEYPKFRS